MSLTPGGLRATAKKLIPAGAWVTIFSLLINLLMLVPPLFMLQIFDRVLTSGSIPTLVTLSAMAVGLLIVLGLLEWTRKRVMVHAGVRLDTLVSERLFHSGFAESRRAGRETERIFEDLTQVRQFLTGAGVYAFLDAPWTPIFLAVLFAFAPLIGWASLGAAIILFVIALINELATRRAIAEANAAHQISTAQMRSHLRNVDAISAMRIEPQLYEQWAPTHAEVLVRQAEASKYSAALTSSAKALRLVAQVVILGIGAWLVVGEQITPGVMIASSIIMARALAPIDQAIGAWRGFVVARGAWRRLDELLKNNPPADEPMPLPPPKGLVQAEGLAMAPPGIRKPIIQGVNFTLNPGEAVGLVGPSAAGKSTLARALVGVWPPLAGSVRLDGARLDQWPAMQLGPALGYLPQEVELLDGTIAENIARFGNPDSEAVITAASEAGLHERILQLPDGYETAVGVNGHNLSAGMRQRVALARALYGAPSLIVLDEPNSNLDQDGERALVQAIKALSERGQTVVLISHRVPVLEAVQRVLVMRDGRLAADDGRDAILKRLTQGQNA